MYSWSTLLNESQKHITPKNPNGGVTYLLEKKKEYLQQLSGITGRNTILYFSAFMHKPLNPEVEINDKDINAFMENVHKLDKKKGLDLKKRFRLTATIYLCPDQETRSSARS